jgi:hypothetical protein
LDDARFDLVPGADHSFRIADAEDSGGQDGWGALMQRLTAWFLGP